MMQLRDNPRRWTGRMAEFDRLLKARAAMACRAVPDLIKALERDGGQPPPPLADRSLLTGSIEVPPTPFARGEGERLDANGSQALRRIHSWHSLEDHAPIPRRQARRVGCRTDSLGAGVPVTPVAERETSDARAWRAGRLQRRRPPAELDSGLLRLPA